MKRLILVLMLNVCYLAQHCQMSEFNVNIGTVVLSCLRIWFWYSLASTLTVLGWCRCFNIIIHSL